MELEYKHTTKPKVGYFQGPAQTVLYQAFFHVSFSLLKVMMSFHGKHILDFPENPLLNVQALHKVK